MIQITLLTNADGHPLTKRIGLDAEGKPLSDGSACVMGQGHAERVHIKGLQDLPELIETLRHDQAISLGALKTELRDCVEIVTKKRLNGAAEPGVIARTADHINYRPGAPALVLIDFDAKGMPEEVRERVKKLGGVWQAVVSVAPGLARAARVVRSSTSAGLSRADTGEPLAGSGGLHIYLEVADGSDIPRFLKDLHNRCWLQHLGWYSVGKSGQLLERSLIDRMVGAPERIVFEGPPVLAESVKQNRDRPEFFSGEAVDSAAIVQPLTSVEQSRLADLKLRARSPLAAEAAAAREAWLLEKVNRLMERQPGLSRPAAWRIAETSLGGVLLPHIELSFDDAELAGATVHDVLANPRRFVGETLADPLDGVEHGRGKAKIMRRDDGSLWIHSFARGEASYDLKRDAAMVEAAINGLLPVRWTPRLACLGQRLEIHRAEIADGRVASPRVVEALDVVEHIGAGLVAGAVDAAAYPLGFQR